MPSTRRVTRVCDYCASVITPLLSEVRRGKGRFCSLSCSTLYHHPHMPPEERFWAKVDRSGGEEACWLWQGKGRGGRSRAYGRFALTHRRMVGAHIYAYTLTHGPVPAGQQVCHTCDTPLCCNPHHLWAGTQQQNMDDAAAKGRMACGDAHPTRTQPWTRPRGEEHGRAKLTWGEVDEMRRLWQTGDWIQRALARRFGVSFATAGSIVREETWIRGREEEVFYGR